MASIRPGIHTVGEILSLAKFDFDKEAAADYLDGKPDFRRVKVGGIGFDDLDKEINVPYTADELVVSLDGEDSVTLDVELDDDSAEWRSRSFASAADASDPHQD